MKMRHRPAAERGMFNFGWLDTAHSFSFGDYRDPRFLGFRSLRVINEDRVAGGGGFPTHSHADMEIITYILAGKLEHKDSLDTGAVIRSGDVQRMSAGTGIRHSEINASPDTPVHLLQIWLIPSETGIAPGYEQKTLPAASGPSPSAATPLSAARCRRCSGGCIGAAARRISPLSRMYRLQRRSP
jgi:hypothetical protein